MAAYAMVVVTAVLLVSGLALAVARAVSRRAGIYAALLGAAWLGLTSGLAHAGWVDFGGMPPRLFRLVAVSLVLTLVLAFSSVGARLSRLPLWILVGYQGFRIIVELMLYDLHVNGVVPVQMTFAGRNFDIVTGILALALAAWLRWGTVPRAAIWGWEVLGLVLLINIVAIAIMSTPTPLRVFMNEPANEIVITAPFIWLPTVLVPGALLGHLLVARALWAKA